MIESQIRREKGKILVCFADLKAAFDKVKRKEIWGRLRKKGVNEKLIKGLEEIIYDDTYLRVKIEGEIIDEFNTTEGVRQGCPISTNLFNVVVSVLEEEMKKV